MFDIVADRRITRIASLICVLDTDNIVSKVNDGV